MGYVDFILNLAGLLLWLNWRSIRFDPLGRRTPATLIGTLRRAEPQQLRRWHFPVVLTGLLLARAVIYWQIGSATKSVWTGTLDLGVIAPAFVSNSFIRMVLFSCLSFGIMLGVFYLWLLLLSILAGPVNPPFHRLVRVQLGGIDRWPGWLKGCLPLLITSLLWWLASWPLAWLQIIPPSVTPAHRLEEALVIGLGSYLIWKYLAGALLALHLLNSFIYFGRQSFWNYIDVTATALLQPIRQAGSALGRIAGSFLPGAFAGRKGNAHLSPALRLTLTLLLDVGAIALIFLLAGLAERGLLVLHGKLL
jgi:hypothetical protein